MRTINRRNKPRPAVLLRGGSEALRSNLALGSLLSEALAGAGLPAGAVQLLT